MNTQSREQKRLLRLPAWTPGWIRYLLRIGFRITTICTVLFLIVAAFYYYLATQYDLKKVAELSEPSLILAEDGSELASLDKETGTIIQYDQIPPYLVDALLAREDTRFRDHIGIDIKGLARATAKNLLTMSYQEGASTISMQLTKNTYNNKSKSIHRKFLEIAITLRLEAHYSKDEILTHYLNRIYFGSGSHGIEDAAETYFGIHANKLTLGQSALIVGIIRGPHIFSPFNNLEAAIAQRDQVLTRMHDIGMITEKEKDDAMSAPLNLADRNHYQSSSSYAVSSIRRHQSQIIDTAEIKQGGLHINTTINKKLTNKVTTDIINIASDYYEDEKAPLQIAAVILENKTGAIRTIIGGSNYHQSSYNRALDSKPRLGSAFYPFIYLAALDRGKIPIKNQPIVSAKQIGAAEVLSYSKRFGINHNPAKDPAELYRGTIYASPLQLANAYAVIQNNGTFAESYFIESITDKNAHELFVQQHFKKEIVSTGAALNCRKMLGKKTNGTSIIQVTSSPYKHLWIITSDPEHTIAIWAGHDKPADIPNRDKLSETLQKKSLQWLKSAKSFRFIE